MKYRKEKDTMGTVLVPESAYYGPQTQRAAENFPIGDLFALLKEKISLGDALMLTVAKRHLSFISTLVTWDRDHFRDKFTGTVITPDEYISAQLQ